MGGFGTKKPPVGGFTTLLIALIILYFPMVPGAGLEPAQPQWPKDFKSFVSTIPPFEHPFKERAENETRTRDPNLGKVMLYQLSYFRVLF
mgnify:CR=1 FL=1